MSFEASSVALSHGGVGAMGAFSAWERRRGAGCTGVPAGKRSGCILWADSVSVKAFWPPHLQQPRGLCRVFDLTTHPSGRAACPCRLPSTSTMHHAAIHLCPSVSIRLARYRASHSSPVAARSPAHRTGRKRSETDLGHPPPTATILLRTYRTSTHGALLSLGSGNPFSSSSLLTTSPPPPTHTTTFPPLARSNALLAAKAVTFNSWPATTPSGSPSSPPFPLHPFFSDSS